MDAMLKTVAEKALAAQAGVEARFAFDELTLIAETGRLLDLLKFLRDDPQCQFVCFIDITAADYPERAQRFEIVYHLLSPKLNTRVRIKVSTDEASPVPSAIPAFPAA